MHEPFSFYFYIFLKLLMQLEMNKRSKTYHHIPIKVALKTDAAFNLYIVSFGKKV